MGNETERCNRNMIQSLVDFEAYLGRSGQKPQTLVFPVSGNACPRFFSDLSRDVPMSSRANRGLQC